MAVFSDTKPATKETAPDGAVRVSKKPPTVKTKIKNGKMIAMAAAKQNCQDLTMKYEKTLRRNGFDLLHKPGPTVHQYADRPGLFVLTAPLTSGSLSKKEFFDRLE